MRGALSGIKVVEAASYVTGPFASQLLTDMGAEVIKIEEPKRGDPFRGWGERNYSATFCSLNRNKQTTDRHRHWGTYGRDSNLVGLRWCRDRYTARPRSDLKQLE